MVVTASQGNRVLALDDQAALSAYLKRLGAPLAVHDDAEAFTHFAMTHPLGLSRRGGDEVRFVAGVDLDGSLTCIAAVPQGSMVRIMEGDSRSVLEATNIACESALAGLEGRRPLGVLAFDCIARKGVLGDDGIVAEVERIATYAAGAPVAGFLRTASSLVPTVWTASTTKLSLWLLSHKGWDDVFGLGDATARGVPRGPYYRGGREHRGH